MRSESSSRCQRQHSNTMKPILQEIAIKPQLTRASESLHVFFYFSCVYFSRKAQFLILKCEFAGDNLVTHHSGGFTFIRSTSVIWNVMARSRRKNLSSHRDNTGQPSFSNVPGKREKVNNRFFFVWCSDTQPLSDDVVAAHWLPMAKRKR